MVRQAALPRQALTLLYKFPMRCCLLFIAALLAVGCQARPPQRTPLRYLVANHTITVEAGKPALVLVHWELEFDPAVRGPGVFPLPRSNFIRTYQALSAQADASGVRRPLAVVRATRTVHDLDGSAFQIIDPAVVLDDLAPGERVLVDFARDLDPGEATVYVPDEAIVLGSTEVRSKDGAVNVITAGFERGPVRSDGAWTVQQFSLAASSGATATRGGAALPFVSAASYTDWGQVARLVAPSYKAELAKEVELGLLLAAVPDALKQMPAGRERTRAIANHLFKSLVARIGYQSVGSSPHFRNSPRPLESTLQRRIGDCKDLALVFVKLLASQGIAAEPVLVAIAGDRNLPRKVAAPRQGIFNHVIVYIPQIDEYADPATGPGTFLTTWSDIYANTYGLHLFSEQYRVIKPGVPNGSVALLTTVRKVDGQWLGQTSWRATGAEQGAIASVQNSMEKSLDRGAQPRWLERFGVRTQPGSWRATPDQLHGINSAGFAFALAAAPVDARGMVTSLPRPFVPAVLLRYDNFFPLRPHWMCFEQASYRETLVIEGGAADARLAPVSTVALAFGSTTFTQKIDGRDGKFTLERVLEINETRVVCPASETAARKALFAQIRAVQDQTAALMAAKR